MDHLNLARDVKFAESLGVDYLHIDIMDDHMVPRFGLYPEIVEHIASISNIRMDVHLMIDNVENYIMRYADIENIEYISFHADENNSNLFRIADLIHKMNKKPVLVFNLSSNINFYQDVLSNDIWKGIMLMGIHPGILDQIPRPELVIDKLRYIKKTPELKSKNFIQIDGAVNFKTIPSLIKNGANNLICGSSSLYKGISYREDNDERIYQKTAQNYNEIMSLANES